MPLTHTFFCIFGNNIACFDTITYMCFVLKWKTRGFVCSYLAPQNVGQEFLWENMCRPYYRLCLLTVNRILSVKNVRAWVSMDFTQDKFSAPIAIEKIKILGAPWELPAKQHCQFGQFGPNLR